MPSINPYWKKLSSTAVRFLKDRGKKEACFVVKNSSFDVEYSHHDNWNGGIDYWNLVFELKYKDYFALGDKKNTVEGDIMLAFNQFHTDDNNPIANVIIQPLIEQFIDWNAVYPSTKADILSIIKEEQNMLTDVATGKLSFKEDNVEYSYQKRHLAILDYAERAGFEYPIKANTLAEWWIEVKTYSTYAERREYISSLVSPLLKTLRESDDNSVPVNFQQIAKKSEIIQKAVEDANVFIREGKYDSSMDRVHTALHGYLRELLVEHKIAFKEDDSLPALFTKLYHYYSNSIQPVAVGERVKGILRSASGMINAVNELRNNNTIAHPNGQLIQAREAHLVIRLVNAVVDYIEDVESQAILFDKS